MYLYEYDYPLIGKTPKFYGYVMGLNIVLPGDHCPLDNEDSTHLHKLVVTFYYNGKYEHWEVPDENLFKELQEHLDGNAWSFKNVDGGMMDKVWIEWNPKTKKWIVDLP